MTTGIRSFIVGIFIAAPMITASAQTFLTLEQCRQMALNNNKELRQNRLELEITKNNRLAAETNFLPKVQAVAGYIHTGKEMSILNKDQKNTLHNLGTNMTERFSSLVQSQQVQNILAQHPELAPLVQQVAGSVQGWGTALNGVGDKVVDAFRTDTRNMFGGALLLTQPLYMGGKIRAYDKITHYSEALAQEKLRAGEQEIILEVDRAYWQIVSLANKLKLAESYRETLQKLDDDVVKMIQEGVATKANELQVDVKLNEAEMTVTKVEDGLVLSRMLLAQLCGMPTPSNQPQGGSFKMTVAADSAETTVTGIYLIDEKGEIRTPGNISYTADAQTAFENRPEIKQLETAVNIYREKVKIERAAFLPQVALTGGVVVTNPNTYNGFQNKFSGNWNVGITFKMPVWNWGEGKYKIRAAKAEAQMTEYRTDEIKEKVELQVAQEKFRVSEADKKLRLSNKNLEKADENVRIANLGYKEGVIVLSDVLSAHTAWLQAHSDYIDAQIDVMLSRAALEKALGISTPDTYTGKPEQGKVHRLLDKMDNLFKSKK